MGIETVSLQLKQREKMCVKRTIYYNVRKYQKISFISYMIIQKKIHPNQGWISTKTRGKFSWDR